MWLGPSGAAASLLSAQQACHMAGLPRKGPDPKCQPTWSADHSARLAVQASAAGGEQRLRSQVSLWAEEWQVAGRQGFGWNS